jgi:deoxycytidylate deaminase
MATFDELSKKKQKYFNVALNAAKLSDYGKFRHGALLVKGGSIINIGYNNGGHSKFGSFHRCLTPGVATNHAEISTVKCLP